MNLFSDKTAIKRNLLTKIDGKIIFYSPAILCEKITKPLQHCNTSYFIVLSMLIVMLYSYQNFATFQLAGIGFWDHHFYTMLPIYQL